MSITVEEVIEMEPLLRLSKDLKIAARTMSVEQARFVVDRYYQVQHERITSGNQIRASSESGEPAALIEYMETQWKFMEGVCKSSLAEFAKARPIGQWLTSIYGIGPVIASGLIAHIDIHKAVTYGHIWSFAGLNPNTKWEKGEKRPWNAALKTLCWKAGQSFMKFSNREDCFYGKLYRQRKAEEIERNERGGYADHAAKQLTEKSYKRDTATKQAYQAGRLSAGHIDAIARRWTVKMFLSHTWEVWRRVEGLPVSAPYPVAHMGHVHVIEPPNLEVVGLV